MSSEEKGYVVCLLKYMIDASTSDPSCLDKQSGNPKAICLGYFGRADIVPITQFKDYMRVASENDAEFVGSRKQLLLYPFGEGIANQIKLTDSSLPHDLPFQPADGEQHPCFCCLSILNVNQLLKDKMDNDGIRTIAQCLSDQIKSYTNDTPLSYAVMGLLGTEDICVILLSDSFPAISGVIEHLRGLIDLNSKELVISNSHSVIMVDYSGQAQSPVWGTTDAEIRFSLKTADGLTYLETIKNHITAQPNTPMVVLESHVGEYDAVIRCPASALSANLYGQTGLLNYANKDYRNAAYQSETILYQEINSMTCVHTEVKLPSSRSAEPDSTAQLPFSEMKKFVDGAVAEINSNMLGTEDDPQDTIAYIRLGLFRLLKDFMRIASIPFGGTFQQDLYVQFRVAVNAIVFAAKRYKAANGLKMGAKEDFDNTFSLVVNALSNSMQAASQIDRLSFEEQQSHLQNTGAYHKVLLAYYGIVKDILSLLYAIKRKENSKQPILIPLLSFGHTPIIFSEPYPSTYEGQPAKLICITLPYQALSNIPKHIGLLVHELFHYSTPTDRELRNQAAGEFLISVAFQQFLCAVASRRNGSDQAGRDVFLFYQKEFLSVVEKMYDNIHKNQVKCFSSVNPDSKVDPSKYALDSGMFFRTIHMALLPHSGAMEEAVKALYCSAWAELREQLQSKTNISAGISSLFALDQDFTSEEETLASIQEIYEQVLPTFLPSVKSHLTAYEKALREVPPDLFDIGFVMHEKQNKRKAQQYLWQIHGIRRDKLYYNYYNKADGSKFDGNTIRIGIVLDYLIFGFANPKAVPSFEEMSKQISDYLEQWYSDNPSWQIEERNQVREFIASEYEAYHSESIFVNIMLKNYLEPIARQIQGLSSNEDMAAIMQRLSDFYSQYYTALEVECKEKRTTDLFNLAICIIEYYQKQPTLAVLCQACVAPSTEFPATNLAPEDINNPFEGRWEHKAKALHPKDLSGQIVRAYTNMVPKGGSTPLWFRGQEKESWPLLPGIMRDGDKKLFSKDHGFLPGMRRMLTLAKAKILPQGENFHQAEWLAFLQHNEFKTNLLDWSEDLYSALFFAIESWMKDPEVVPKEDASISVFNPILFNLAQDMLEKRQKFNEDRSDPEAKENYQDSFKRLCKYLKTGVDTSEEYAIPLFTNSENDVKYKAYFDLDPDSKDTQGPIRYPIAAMTPANSERMKKQAGAFVFFDVHSKPDDSESSYAYLDLKHIQVEYQKIVKTDPPPCVSNVPHPRPFLVTITLNRDKRRDFINYIHAIGIRKHKMYPEIDKLVDDITKQAFYGLEP